MAFIDDFRERFPEFISVTDERILIFENIWPTYFTGDYVNVAADKEAALNIVAHLLTMDLSAGASGAAASGNIASKSVGNVSVSYRAPSSQSELRDFFGGTKYGMMFLMATMHRKGAVFV